MSIKEHVEFAKEELTQDEKLLSGLIKAERFYKRNRAAILTVAVLVAVGGIAYGIMGYLKEQRLLRANAAFLQLQKNPSDKGALETLKKENPPLARLVLLRHATQAGDMSTLGKLAEAKDAVVSDLARYHLGVWKKDAEAIKNYRMRSDAFLKDFAIFDEAYLLMKAGKVSQDRERLAMIGDNSPLKAAARMLNHYGIVASGKEGSR